MKKLLLLSALFIFACSSDDSSDTSNQTFLERFDGVVWQSADTEVEAFKIIDNDNYSSQLSYIPKICPKFKQIFQCTT